MVIATPDAAHGQRKTALARVPYCCCPTAAVAIIALPPTAASLPPSPKLLVVDGATAQGQAVRLERRRVARCALLPADAWQRSVDTATAAARLPATGAANRGVRAG